MSEGAPAMAWWTPGGYRMWTCASCGHHSIADALEACPTCLTARPAAQPEQAIPPPRARRPRATPAARRPAARRTAAKKG